MYFFILGNWFSPNSSADTAGEISDGFIGIIKNIIEGFCKVTIERLIKYWPRGHILFSRSRKSFSVKNLRLLLYLSVSLERFLDLLLLRGNEALSLVYPTLTSF